jgi:hypothetical protein
VTRASTTVSVFNRLGLFSTKRRRRFNLMLCAIDLGAIAVSVSVRLPRSLQVRSVVDG